MHMALGLSTNQSPVPPIPLTLPVQFSCVIQFSANLHSDPFSKFIAKICIASSREMQHLLATSCPFLENPVNFSGPKSHFLNCDPLILKSWSFTMISRYEGATLLQNFMLGNVFCFKISRKL